MSELKEKEESIKIQDFIPIIVAKWYWFLIGVVICLLIGVIYIKRTEPIYTRTASIVIKDDSKTPQMGGGANSAFSGMDLFKSNVNINNELLTLQSATLLMNVIKQLNLNYEYTFKSGLMTKNLYKKSPISIQLFIGKQIQQLSCQVEINDSINCSISKLEYWINNEKFELPKLNANFGDTIRSSYGKLLINKTSNFDLKESSNRSIQFQYSNILDMAIRISKRLNIELGDKEATFINLTLQDASISRANDILNTLIYVYNQNWVKNKNLVAKASNQFINQRLIDLSQDLNRLDNTIAEYKSKNLLPDIVAVSKLYLEQSGKNKENILELNNQMAMGKYIQEYLKKNLSITELVPANTGIDNKSIETQISDYNTLVLQRNTLITNSSSTNPVIMDMTHSLEEMKTAILTSLNNFIKTCKAELEGFYSADNMINEKIATSPNQAKYLLTIGREQEIKQELYLYLLQKREENELSQAFTAYNTQIVNPPYGLEKPTSPVKPLIIIIALIIGIVLPGIILFAKETLNTTVRGRKDLEKYMIPFIGEIPLFSLKKVKELSLRKKNAMTAVLKSDIVVKEGSRNYVNEAFRVTHTNMDFMQTPSEKGHVIMLTSFNPGSGKTYISLNLAMTSAIRNKKVIVVDLDLRKAALSESIDPSKQQKVGITNYLSGQESDYNKIIAKNKIHSGYDFITVGPLPPNPTELLLSNKLNELLEKLRNEYDYIYLDCPPVNMVADATIITKYVDLTLFVIRTGKLDRRMLPILDEMYKKETLKNLGIILNGIPRKSNGYGYGYGYGYGN